MLLSLLTLSIALLGQELAPSVEIQPEPTAQEPGQDLQMPTDSEADSSPEADPDPDPDPDPEAEALAAWLQDGAPVWDTPTARFLRDLELGMTLDLLAEFTEKKNSVQAFNDFRVRSAQLNFASPVAGLGRAFFTLDFADGGDGSELILREAGALLENIAGNHLPGQWDVQVGKYQADLGAWNTTLANEFPAPSFDGTRRAFFSGNLVMSGVELHHRVSFSGGLFRWSLGLAGDTESQDVDQFGNGLRANPNIIPFGRRGVANWTGTWRGSLQWDHGGGWHSRMGASALYAPEEPFFTDLGNGVTERAELHHTVYGFDAGFLWENPNSGRRHELSLEVWVQDNQYRNPDGLYVGDESRGEWGMYEYTYSPQWSAGALFSRYDVLGLSAFDLDASYHVGFLSYHYSEQSRLSLFFSHTNPSQTSEKFFIVGAQLTMSLGAKRKVAIPRWY